MFGSPDLVLNASGLSDNFDDWFSLATDILLSPSFPADELEKLKQRQRIQIRQQRTAANFLLNERFSRAVYGQHPAAIVSATAESIDKLSRDALLMWHRERVVPQNAILGVAGDIHPKEFIAKLEKRLAAWKMRDVKPRLAARPGGHHRRANSFSSTGPFGAGDPGLLGNIAIDRWTPIIFP